MTGQTREQVGWEPAIAYETLDAESVDRIDVHLERALTADDRDTKDFHVRHARQLLEACRE